jgi:hypothetical protein
MDFESLKQLLKSNEMEEAQYAQSNDICKKDGDHINTIQVIDDEKDQGRLAVTAHALNLLERAIKAHLELHQPDYNLSLFEDASTEAVTQSQF